MSYAWTVKSGDGQLLVYCVSEDQVKAMRTWLTSHCAIVVGALTPEGEIRRMFRQAAKQSGAKLVGIELVEKKR